MVGNCPGGELSGYANIDVKGAECRGVIYILGIVTLNFYEHLKLFKEKKYQLER